MVSKKRKGKQMILKNTENRIVMVGYRQGGKSYQYRVMPGTNDIPENLWSVIGKISVVKRKIEHGKFVLNNEKTPFQGMTIAKKIKVIEDSTDLSWLKSTAKTETGKVKEAAAERIKLIEDEK
jgi:hypothetical protein